MNTNPDNQTLLLWLEDELSKEEQLSIDAWVAEQPVWIAKREAVRQWRQQVTRLAPSSEELPYGDFFQSRLMRSLEKSDSIDTAKPPSVINSPWRKFWLPASVAAAMVLGFFGGVQWQGKPQRAKILVTYTPAEGVQAEFFESSPAEGTVIVLNGIDALPDAFVSTETTSLEPHFLNEPLDHKNERGTLVSP